MTHGHAAELPRVNGGSDHTSVPTKSDKTDLKAVLYISIISQIKAKINV
jgi:hypothetical protein